MTPEHLIFFDGVCNFCNSSVLWIIKRDRKKIFYFASLQSKYAQEILSQFKVNTQEIDSIIYIKRNKVFIKSTAALEIAKDLKNSWSCLYILKIIPQFLRDMVYDLFAKQRYRLFGKKSECMIPDPELKERFLS
ncbi:MAG: DCC1-like thiol-disulfide oxidoreductase family protein [Chitinophagales bacterium]|nr:DCC1-like thiol-disulfide oxidoreductase family protein [Chitinophagales bacterium]